MTFREHPERRADRDCWVTGRREASYLPLDCMLTE